MQIKRRISAIVLSLAAASMLTSCGSTGGADHNDGIVRSVVSAPVTPDGTVAGRSTDIVINLNVSPDPEQAGYTLRKGDRIRVSLPAAFKQKNAFPLLIIFDCIASYPQCDTVVPLEGWPQGALGAPAPLGYELVREGPRTLVITAMEDFIARPPVNPGLKQIHLLLNSSTNPPPGRYPVGVELSSAGGVKQGTGRVDILSKTRPAIAVTNAFHDNFANGNYQVTAPGSLAPLPFDFLLWDRGGAPLMGVTIDANRLVHGDEVVGRVTIEAPVGAIGQRLFTEKPSVRAKAPVTGIDGGHLRAFFRAGTVPGKYRVRFELGDGNVEEMVVCVR